MWNKKLSKDELKEVIAALPPDLRKLSFAITVAAGTTGTIKEKIPTGRGMFYSLAVFAGSIDIVDAAAATFTSTLDGRNIHEDESALAYAQNFDARETDVKVIGWGGSTFNVSLDNSGGANEVTIYFQFSFSQANGLDPNS